MGRKKDKKNRKSHADDFDQDRAHDDGMPPAPEDTSGDLGDENLDDEGSSST